MLLVALALALCGFVALPLVFPQQADPLPDYGDPVLRELQEERDALFRAIREVEARVDLADARRSELRARYEAKAAGVLRLIDERESEISASEAAAAAATPAPARRSRIPYAGLAMLSLAAVTAISLSEFVFPRVSQDQTVTTFFEDDLAASQALRDLQRAVDRDPSTANRLALADAYWRIEDAQRAEEAYRELLETASPVPAIVFRRLGFLALQDDLEQGAIWLEQAAAIEPDDAQTLFTLGEVHLVLENFERARDAFTAYLDTAEGAGDETADARLELIDAVASVAAAAQERPTEENLIALADVYWTQGERQRAVSVYFRVLTEVSPTSLPALTRTAEALFLSGRPDDAVQLFERARAVASSRGEEIGADALLLLGNAYFAQDDYQSAIEAWERHLEQVSDPGRVPDLIASAEARLAGGSAAAQASGGERATEATRDQDGTMSEGAANDVQQTTADAQQLYRANCATCHGAAGQGGFGPALVNNPRARDAGNVASIVRFGRGSMPGFGAILGEGNLQILVEYVTQDLSQTARNAP